MSTWLLETAKLSVLVRNLFSLILGNLMAGELKYLASIYSLEPPMDIA